MTHIFTDGLSQISFANNNLRISLVQNGPDNTVLDAGTLIIPVNQASNFINAMANGLKHLNEQMKAKAAETEGETQ
jgi:hypothetical protein